MINEIQLRQISPVISRPNAQIISQLLDKICPIYGIDKKDIPTFIKGNFAHTWCFIH